jgi:hypothetical protein
MSPRLNDVVQPVSVVEVALIALLTVGNADAVIVFETVGG